jgi:adenine-specific DNA glycosylase
MLPNLKRPARATPRRFVAFVLEHRGCFLVRQRPAGVINAHLWEFPNVELTADSPALEDSARLVLKTIPSKLDALCVIKHTITRYRITLEAYHARVARRPARTDGQTQWLALKELDALPFTSANRKVLGFVESLNH